MGKLSVHILHLQAHIRNCLGSPKCSSTHSATQFKGYHQRRLARAPAGRCKGVHLHPTGFCFSVFSQNTIHAQSLTRRRRQSLFYGVKYDIRCWCTKSIHLNRYAFQTFTSLWVCIPWKISWGRPCRLVTFVNSFLICVKHHDIIQPLLRYFATQVWFYARKVENERFAVVVKASSTKHNESFNISK